MAWFFKRKVTPLLVPLVEATSLADRRRIAIELASGRSSDEVIRELKYMIKGGIRSYAPRTYRTLWLKRRIRYGTDDAIIAIEALGETKRADALAFLRKLYTSKTFEVQHREQVAFQSVDPIYGRSRSEVTEFPNAPLAIQPLLNYTIAITNLGSWDGEGEYLDVGAQRDECSNRPIHKAFSNSIEKLERATTQQ